MGSLEKEVLNELKPNSDTLKELSIMSYVGTQFSYWKMHISTPFGLLPSLQYLSIQGKDAVEVIGMEVTGGGDVAFPSLKFLSFEDMLGLGEWSTKNEGLVAVFPCLHVLYITNCPQLTNVSLQALTSLKVLEIDGCGDGVLRSLVQVASSITKLRISSFLGLTYKVWRGVIKYLQIVEELRISECNEIEYLWESETEASKLLVKLKEIEITEMFRFGMFRRERRGG
ncbi:putative leucine-rich repeat domain superfamily [Helianthus annuus]|nr:putative leucine-rich repeat domain superfamily [Helianthus annuus]